MLISSAQTLETFTQQRSSNLNTIENENQDSVNISTQKSTVKLKRKSFENIDEKLGGPLRDFNESDEYGNNEKLNDENGSKKRPRFSISDLLSVSKFRFQKESETNEESNPIGSELIDSNAEKSALKSIGASMFSKYDNSGSHLFTTLQNSNCMGNSKNDQTLTNLSDSQAEISSSLNPAKNSSNSTTKSTKNVKSTSNSARRTYRSPELITVPPGYVTDGCGANLANIRCTLEPENQALWTRFSKIGTEMIITKPGRRMFPTMKIRLDGCEPDYNYYVYLDAIPVDGKRYRYVYSKSAWYCSGKADRTPSNRLYVHPDSPFNGAQIRLHSISFEKAKLTNNESDNRGHLVLNSMHKYQPRVHVLRQPRSQLPLENSGATIDLRLPQYRDHYRTFRFGETQFMAVTAYQNQLVTEMKIAMNPFAKGFRDHGNRSDTSPEFADSNSNGRNICGVSMSFSSPPKTTSFSKSLTTSASTSSNGFCGTSYDNWPNAVNSYGNNQSIKNCNTTRGALPFPNTIFPNFVWPSAPPSVNTTKATENTVAIIMAAMMASQARPTSNTGSSGLLVPATDSPQFHDPRMTSIQPHASQQYGIGPEFGHESSINWRNQFARHFAALVQHNLMSQPEYQNKENKNLEATQILSGHLPLSGLVNKSELELNSNSDFCLMSSTALAENSHDNNVDVEAVYSNEEELDTINVKSEEDRFKQSSIVQDLKGPVDVNEISAKKKPILDPFPNEFEEMRTKDSISLIKENDHKEQAEESEELLTQVQSRRKSIKPSRKRRQSNC